MARLDHLAVYTTQLEVLRAFYLRYFQATSNEKYLNLRKGFASYFLSFGGDARLEIMQKDSVSASGAGIGEEYLGITHLALSVGRQEEVDSLTERLRTDGYTVVGEPRRTGDGYYESVILDPDGNRVEIVADP
ncbi:VOC family protein [Salmonirosea aquatica]|uniref:Glyoxalase n=1 Tax=Salmonirosea aquatica TaxID=2654236 RepID=A0A7C9F744_9BACT|nr:glyoxalase [Cytophagaceae bacterium SJW1-29]